MSSGYATPSSAQARCQGESCAGQRGPSALVRRDEPDRSALHQRGRRLEYLTVGDNLLEGVVAVVSGLIAASIALVGFGFDSAIEVTSGVALLWRHRPIVELADS